MTNSSQLIFSACKKFLKGCLCISTLGALSAFASDCQLPKESIKLRHTLGQVNTGNANTLSWLSSLITYAEDLDIDTLLSTAGITNYKIVLDYSRTPLALVATIKKDLVIVYRGTNNSGDIINDYKFTPIYGERYGIPGRIHEGFLNTYVSTWELVQDAINEVGGDIKSVWVSGYSMGASLAALAAYKLNSQAYHILGVYGFGAPLVGDAEFSDGYNSILGFNTFLFKYGRDIVPHLPPTPATKEEFLLAVTSVWRNLIDPSISLMNYKHHGQSFTIKAQNTFTVDNDPVASDRDYWKYISETGDLLPDALKTNPVITDDHRAYNMACN